MSTTQLGYYEALLKQVEARKEKFPDHEEKLSLLRELIQLTEQQNELQGRIPVFQSPELTELEEKLKEYRRANREMQEEHEALSKTGRVALCNKINNTSDDGRFSAMKESQQIERKMADNTEMIFFLEDKLRLTREVRKLETLSSVSEIVKKFNTWKLNHERLRTTITDLLDCDLSSDESVSEQQDEKLMNSEFYLEKRLKECRESILITKEEYDKYRQMSNEEECEVQKEMFEEECEELEIRMRPTLDMIRLLESQLKLIRKTKQLYKQLQKQNEQDGKLKVVRVTPELLDQLDEHFSQLGKDPEENEKKWTEFFSKMAFNVYQDVSK